MDTVATCLIDNGLAASTTAARVAASARAGVYDALQAGYSAMFGSLHGGAPIAAYRLLERALEDDDVDRVIAESAAGGYVPGFGHVIYTGDDPRATVVLDLIRAERPGAPALAALDAIAAKVDRRINIDLAGAVVAHTLGLPPQAGEVLFQYGRTVGMAAHIAEEYDEAPLRWRGANSGGGAASRAPRSPERPRRPGPAAHRRPR